jgi:hypothetical protein
VPPSPRRAPAERPAADVAECNIVPDSVADAQLDALQREWADCGMYFADATPRAHPRRRLVLSAETMHRYPDDAGAGAAWTAQADEGMDAARGDVEKEQAAC